MLEDPTKMANLQKQILEKELHDKAQVAVETYANELTDALVLESKILATLEGSDEVQTVHIEKARTIVLNASQVKNRKREILILSGSVLLGASFQGIPTEYINNRPSLMIFYFIIGFVGLSLTFWGFKQ